MRYTKKIFVIMFSFFVIAVLVSFSYAHFVNDGQSESFQDAVRIVTKSITDFNNKLITTYERENGIIDTGFLETADTFTKIFKFKVEAIGPDNHNIDIILENTYSTINTDNSALYV